jgi:hypothetical protein
MEIININDQYRYIDATDDLIPIKDVYPTKYIFDIPTVVPINWKPYVYISQEEYSVKFSKSYPIIDKILKNTTNIVVAGGAAANPIYVENRIYIHSDIDIFIYGILDEVEFWKKVNEIALKIVSLIDQKLNITQKIKRGILIIGIHNSCGLIIEYQIILRMYHTMSSIIHAFDIPSCCILYDGTTTYTTTLGAYAYSNQVNLVYTKYRSTSFEKRLIKYFNRGYGLGFIGYDIKKAYNNSLQKLSHKYLNIDIIKIDINNINNIVGNINTKNYYKNSVEYNSIKSKYSSYNDLIVHIQQIEDVGLVLKNNNIKIIDYTNFYDMKLSEIIKLFPNGIEALIDKQSEKIQNIELKNIQKIPFPTTIILEIVDIILNYKEYIVHQKIKNILYEQINMFSDYIPNWIIIQDPQQQYTASINPIIDDPEDWYGNDLYIK